MAGKFCRFAVGVLVVTISATVFAASFTSGQLEKLSGIPPLRYRVVVNTDTSARVYTGTWVATCCKVNDQWKLSHDIKVSFVSLSPASLYGQADGLLTAWRDHPTYAKYSASLLYAADKVTVRRTINQGSPTTKLYDLPPAALALDFSDLPFFLKASYDAPALHLLYLLYQGQPQWKVRARWRGRYWRYGTRITVLGMEPLEQLVTSPAVTAAEIKAAFVRSNDEGIPLSFTATQGGNKVEATLNIVR